MRQPTPTFPNQARLKPWPPQAGLNPETVFQASWAYTYPDDETLGRALIAPAGVAVLVGPDREEAIKAAIVEGLAEHRAPDGSYELSNEFHYLVARA